MTQVPTLRDSSAPASTHRTPQQYLITDIEPLLSGVTVTDYSDSYRALATDSSSDRVQPVILRFPRLSTVDDMHIYTVGIRYMAYSHSHLVHPNIDTIVQLLQLPNRPLAVVQNFKRNGDIMTHMDRLGQACDVWSLIKDTARGLAYLHENNTVHGNVHPSNVLIDNDGHACLTDIGIHSLLFSLRSPKGTPATFTHRPAEEFFEEVGNTLLSAPTKEGDVYAFASTVYHILTGRAPYESSRWPYTRELQHIRDHGHISLPKPHQVGDEAWRTILGCWAREPQNRLTMAQVVFALEQNQFD